MDRREIAHLFRTMGALLEIKGEEGFKVKAYERAAESLLRGDYDLDEMARQGRLLEIPGIGRNLEPKLREIIETGRSSFLERLVQEIPEGLLDLLRVPGIGPKTARLLHESLGVASLEDLEGALREHRVQSLPGLGRKREELMERGLREIRKYAGRLNIGTALPLLEDLAASLGSTGLTCRIVGETRRFEETVGSLEVLIRTVPGEEPAKTLERTGVVPGSRSALLERWDPAGRAFVLPTSFGVPLLLHFCEAQGFGARIARLTGPESFLEALAARARDQGLCLDWDHPELDSALASAADEASFLELLGFPPVPPEVRHRPGLIEAARKGDLDLVSVDDLMGDLHVHTVWSDGSGTVEQMVQRARKLGYSYIAITDHASEVKLIQGLDPERLRLQMAEIREVSKKYPDIRVLTGVEVDILREGRLYLPDEILAELDVVVASVHQDISDSTGESTRRLLKAASNPHVDILGHPTGRLIGRRPGQTSGLEPVFQACARYGVALEVNSSPDRLDLCEDLVARAVESGARLAVCTDAHSPDSLEDVRFGVSACCRRAGLSKTMVVNAGAWPPTRAS